MPDIKAILDLWFKLRETPKETLRIWEFGGNNPWDYSIKKDLEQAFDLDPEGLTALLLLDNFRTDFFTNCGLSIQDILGNENYLPFIQDCQRMTHLLSAPEIVSALTSFVDGVSHAIEHMGIHRENVAEMLNDRYEMAILRRDSLRSMETLSLHQFFQGDTATDHLAYLPDIHLFWNMNSLIRCAWQSPNGVSINLVKDPLDTSSYFAFVAKNGGNLTVLTDKPKEAHPLSKYMARRPEKDFTRRIFRNHFPYGLLDLTFDHKGYAHPGDTSIVPLQSKPIKIGSIADMLPDEIIWTVMMFSLLDSKLYKENYHCGELSYTSDMIADPEISQKLLTQGQGEALMVKNYKPLVAPILTTESLDDKEQYSNYSGSGINDWLYDRYKDQIPTDILNGLLPNDGSTLFLMPSNDTFLAPKDRLELPYHAQEPVLLEPVRKEEYVVFSDGHKVKLGRKRIEGAVPLKKMTGDEFGSAESLMRDYTWFARHNAAKFIQKKADEEFQARKDEVKAWVMERIGNNIERICKDIVSHVTTEGTRPEHPCLFYFTDLKGEWYRRVSTIDTLTFVKDRKAHLRRPGTYHYPLHNLADAGCWFSENAPCSYLAKACAVDVSDLLYLTGCESVEELPDVLRHWHSSKYSGPYIGNSILDRIDPMDWVVESPWDTLHFDPVIGIGKKFYSRVKKECQLENNSFSDPEV